ncbi:hypothetical protein GGR50DRAFT_611415 [Xylaria sp. CBS 124048]|nr:hypothetical protein GGR50DRAFT_611415 [Xylaria sp. CBS 124048]
MDSRSYSPARRGTAPLLSATPAAASTYKANVNRTKTRKWVEAKAQNYDGDDWGNEYDEYDDDNDDEHREPEPEPQPQPGPLPSSRFAGLRPVGQTDQNLPSSRTFPSTTGSRAYSPTTLRDAGPSRPFLQHAQTQPITGPQTSSPYATGPAHPIMPPKPQNSVPVSTSSWSPVTKSSTTQRDRSDVADITITTTGPSSASLNRASVPEAKTSPLARPYDHNRQWEHEKRPEQPPVSSVPAIQTSEHPLPPGELNDEVKSDIINSRKFSTSPQLPSLMPVSGFGEDLFSGSINMTTGAFDRADNQTSSGTLKNSPGVDEILESRKELAALPSQQSPSPRPQLPGTWVSNETTSLSTSARNASISHIPESDAEPYTGQMASNSRTMSPSVGTPGNASNAEQANTLDGGAQVNPTAAEAPATSAQYLATQSRQSLRTANSPTQPSSWLTATALPTVQGSSPQIEASPITYSPTGTTIGSEIASTAPLDPVRIDAAQPDYYLPFNHERKTTNSTIDTPTPSPQKESDKLHDEIIKSLSPEPIPTSASGPPIPRNFDREPARDNAARESTYLSGVYDDYLSSPADEKSSQEELRHSPKLVIDTSSHQFKTIDSASGSQHSSVQPSGPDPIRTTAMEPMARLRRFSWQKDPEDAAQNPVQPASASPMVAQESPASNQGGLDAMMDTTIAALSTVSNSVRAETSGSGTAPYHVTQDSSRGPGEDSSIVIDLSSPISFTGANGLMLASDDASSLPFSLGDEKDKSPMGDAQSPISNTTDIGMHHAALTEAPGPEVHDYSHSAGPAPGAPGRSSLAPTPFREILNFGSSEERIRGFDETREQFYVMDSGLSDWLAHLQSQPEHADVIVTGSMYQLPSRPGAQASPTGTANAPQLPYKANVAAASHHQRRSSISHVQQLLAGQSGSLGASGDKVGTKSKELLHAAGAFGNKGVKSGMKLFNKGKSKLRERAGGDKTFF